MESIKPEIQPGDFVRIGNGKELWRVISRTSSLATIKEKYLGTMRYSIHVERLTKVQQEGSLVSWIKSIAP